MVQNMAGGGGLRKIAFLHGAGGNSSYWHLQKEYLSSSAEVILVDLPGHGRANGDGFHDIDDYTKSVAETMLSSAPGGWCVAGHSMGGAIAMSLALRYPHLVTSLILMATGARLKVFPQILEGILKDKENTVRNIMQLAFSSKAPPHLVEMGFKEMMKSGEQVTYGDFYACDRFDFMAELASIKIPTLILCGTEDALTPPKYSQHLNREIPGSELVLIPDAGHMVMLEKPDETNRAIEAFLLRQ
jgi:pimeloyl-ACP methyl ester carboxylesterase